MAQQDHKNVEHKPPAVTAENDDVDAKLEAEGRARLTTDEETDQVRPDGRDAATPTSAPTASSPHPAADGQRNRQARRPEFMDPTFSNAALEMVNGPLARMSRDITAAAQNVLRIQLPRIDLPAYSVLNDVAFRNTLATFTKSVGSLKLPEGMGAVDSPLWRQMIDSVTTTQRLLGSQQLALLNDAAQQHAQYLASITGPLTNLQAVINDFTRSVNVTWRQLLPNLKHLRKAVRIELLAGCRRAELWPAPSMPIELLEKIAQLAHGGDTRPVLLAVWNHYAARSHAAFEQMITGWNDDPEFAARSHIFTAALQGHRGKLYALTIPALLAQVEGIAGAFVHSSAALGPAPKLGKSGQVVQHVVAVAGNAGIADPDEAKLLHVVLVEAVIEHVQHVSFQSSDFAEQYADLRKRRRLNRHGTLHGIQINYPSAMNSLRCFLLLDALYALLKHARQVAATAAANATS